MRRDVCLKEEMPVKLLVSVPKHWKHHGNKLRNRVWRDEEERRLERQTRREQEDNDYEIVKRRLVGGNCGLQGGMV